MGRGVGNRRFLGIHFSKFAIFLSFFILFQTVNMSKLLAADLQWSPSYSSSSMKGINSITYGNNMFVAVGRHGSIITSTDKGVNWIQRASGISGDLFGVTYGDGKFVAVGSWGTLLTSIDGITWSERNSETTRYLTRITYANGIFVAGGYGGILLTSTDGITWSSRDSGSVKDIVGITFGNGQFVVGLADGNVITSSDAITWTSRATGTTELWAITYGNGKYVASGLYKMLTSTDGISWDVIPSNSIHFSLSFGNGTFVATSNGKVSTSEDGVNWNEQPLGNAEFWTSSYGAGVYLIGGFIRTENPEEPGMDESSAVIYKTSLPENEAPYITELEGNSYLNFGANQYVQYPDLNIYANSFTFETWVHASNHQPWARFFDTSYGSDNFNMHLAYEGNTGRMILEALPQKGFRTNVYQAKTTEIFPTNKWVHVAAVYDHAQKKAFIYWDGELKATGAMDLTNMANAKAQNGGIARPNNFLGKSTWNTDGYFTGDMRDVRFWNKAKSQSEILEQMNVNLTSNEANLVANYKFNHSADGTIAKDNSSNHYHGSIIGCSWVENMGFTSNLVTTENTPVSKTFKVNDDQDVDQLIISVESDNQTLVPNQNISLAGSGQDRTITMNPVKGQSGTATITATVSDGSLSSQSSFLLTVNPRVIILPTLTTDSYTDLTSTTVRISGNLISEGSSPATERGVVFATIENPTIESGTKVIGEMTGGLGVFSTDISGLEPNTTYYARAYAISEDGIGYGEDISFTTPLPLSDLVATRGDQEVILTFSKPIGAESVIVEQSPDGLIWDTSVTKEGITSNSTSATVTGLTNGIEYSFRIVVSEGERAGISNLVKASPNAVPVAQNDYYNTNLNTTLTVDSLKGLLKNDSDADHDSLASEILNQTVNGNVYLESDGSFAYYPNERFRGADQFTYRVYDGYDYSAPATVSIYVYDTLSVDRVVAKPKQTVNVPIRLTSQGNVAGLQFDMNYDHTYLKFESMHAGELLLTHPTGSVEENVYVPFNSQVLGDGQLRIIVANLNNVRIGGEAGVLVNAQFTIDKSAYALADGHRLDIHVHGTVMSDMYGVELTSQFTNVDGWIQLDIDKEEPVINYEFGSDQGQASVQVYVYGDGTGSEISSLKFAEGLQNISYFAASGKNITEGKQFDLTSNTIYTMYAKDEAGNEAVRQIYVMGDTDLSKAVDVTDWVACINYILERVEPTPIQRMVADMNDDKKLNVIDPVIIANVIMAGGYENYMNK
ncbi:LamG-like jellyroll fold domain-containing protein [Ammoniphilus sp. CFH 90114]|uniref:LamG-like jellyroll fold domain-containing protein n=1 Tax=Ammoniphilus sp. CFH 90114 TaxID=2493665 RepID=UPI00100F5D67|nr:LamG-like jellyroll fold domain-containing protein [Ammoniphilus sp. CFH 90114]RXT04487.1 hypothetical protein EIZ39_19900 [Ammoniphilus sp. CFH 90114]